MGDLAKAVRAEGLHLGSDTAGGTNVESVPCSGPMRNSSSSNSPMGCTFAFPVPPRVTLHTVFVSD
jgi:hypothetical protein